MIHGLERTSPKGERFVGRCVYCGKEGLLPHDALKPCDKAPSQDQQVLDAVKGACVALDGKVRNV